MNEFRPTGGTQNVVLLTLDGGSHGKEEKSQEGGKEKEEKESGKKENQEDVVKETGKEKGDAEEDRQQIGKAQEESGREGGCTAGSPGSRVGGF